MLNRSSNVRWRLATRMCLAGVAVTALVLLFWRRQRPSIEEQLRAINAAHAVPDEENAARDYTMLIRGDMASSLTPKPLSEPDRTMTRTVSWHSVDHPQAARWLADHRAVIEALMAASRKPRCWFSASETRRTGWYDWRRPCRRRKTYGQRNHGSWMRSATCMSGAWNAVSLGGWPMSCARRDPPNPCGSSIFCSCPSAGPAVRLSPRRGYVPLVQCRTERNRRGRHT